MHSHSPTLVAASVAIAMLASYVALDLSSSLNTAKGRVRLAWLACGSVAMGFGIWSMHFVAMLAFRLPEITIAYDMGLLILSVVVAIAASALALYTVSREVVTRTAYALSSVFMGAAIAGMHYIGIASMRLGAVYRWNYSLVVLSVVIAVTASFVALQLAVRFRKDTSPRGFWSRGAGGVVMGVAISGMHYTAMSAMTFYRARDVLPEQSNLVATEGLAVAVIGTTLLLLFIALGGSVVDRAFARRMATTEQISRVLESITDAFYSVNRDWEFTYVNSVALQALEPYLSDGRFRLGVKLWDAVPDLKQTKFEEEAIRSMQSGKPAHFELQFGPRQQWFELHVYPSNEGLSVYFQDISSRKKSEQALQEAISARDEFLSIASHELKTPLTTLKLQSEIRGMYLKGERYEAFTPEKLEAMFKNDETQIQKLARLVEDMLDISRISTGRLTIQHENFDICALVREVADRYGPHLMLAGSSLEVEVCSPTFGHWDKFRIEQVLVNLLTNAAKYGNAKPVRITVEKDQKRVRMKVIDHGTGIAPENLDRIFNRFERILSYTHVGGLGLGLYIVRQIVERHRGKISVESRLGEGSTFTVELPL